MIMRPVVEAPFDCHFDFRFDKLSATAQCPLREKYPYYENP